MNPPVEISPPNTFPPSATVAFFKQVGDAGIG
jgi:hypothetical protein